MLGEIGIGLLIGFSILSLMVLLEYLEGKCAVEKCEDDDEE